MLLPAGEFLKALSRPVENRPFSGHREFAKQIRRLIDRFPQTYEKVIAVTVEGISSRVLASPAEVINDILRSRELGDSAVERGDIAEEEREFRARLAGEGRDIFPHFFSERRLIAVEEE